MIIFCKLSIKHDISSFIKRRLNNKTLNNKSSWHLFFRLNHLHQQCSSLLCTLNRMTLEVLPRLSLAIFSHRSRCRNRSRDFLEMLKSSSSVTVPTSCKRQQELVVFIICYRIESFPVYCIPSRSEEEEAFRYCVCTVSKNIKVKL